MLPPPTFRHLRRLPENINRIIARFPEAVQISGDDQRRPLPSNHRQLRL